MYQVELVVEEPLIEEPKELHKISKKSGTLIRHNSKSIHFVHPGAAKLHMNKD